MWFYDLFNFLIKKLIINVRISISGTSNIFETKRQCSFAREIESGSRKSRVKGHRDMTQEIRWHNLLIVDVSHKSLVFGHILLSYLSPETSCSITHYLLQLYKYPYQTLVLPWLGVSANLNLKFLFFNSTILFILRQCFDLVHSTTCIRKMHTSDAERTNA